MLTIQGYLKNGEYNFGSADGHQLRLLYKIATGMKIVFLSLGRSKFYEKLIKEEHQLDPHLGNPPPWED